MLLNRFVWAVQKNLNSVEISSILANARKSDVAEVHNENDLNMLTHVAERTGNMSSYPVEESPPC